MKKIATITTVFILVLMAGSAFSQRYITKNGHIKFYSETPMETIEAHNKQVNSVLDINTGDFVFKVLMKSFEFEKALMQEHFNENYVESDKYPNASFKGKITNLGDIDFTSPGEYEAQVQGVMTIHGVAVEISEAGIFNVGKGQVKGSSKFIIKPEDYNIKIPNTVVNNIAEEIEVTVEVILEEYKK